MDYDVKKKLEEIQSKPFAELTDEEINFLAANTVDELVTEPGSEPDNSTIKPRRKSRLSDFTQAYTWLHGANQDRQNASSSQLSDFSRSNFDTFEYEEYDYHALKAKFRRVRAEMRNENELRKLEQLYVKTLDIYAKYLENYNIAQVRALAEEESNFYQLELKEYEATKLDIENSMNRTLGIAIDKEDFPKLADRFGKLLLYRVNAYHTLRGLGYRAQVEELEAKENELASRFSFKTDLEEFIDLINRRNVMAADLGFTSYQDYALYKRGYFNYSDSELSESIQSIKSYLLPIHKYTYDKEKAKFAEETEKLTVSTTVPRSESAFRTYYRKNYGDDDWELRNVDKLMELLTEPIVQQEYYPQSEIYNIDYTLDNNADLLLYVAERAVDRPARNFIHTGLKNKFIKINYVENGEYPYFNTYYLPDSQNTVLTGQISPSGMSISGFIQAIGIYQANYTRTRLLARKHAQIAASPESKYFIQLAYEFMSLSRMGELLGDKAKRYMKQRVYYQLLSILNRAMLSEFQNKIYNYNETNSMPIDKTALVNIFQELLMEYRLQDYYSEDTTNKIFRTELIEKSYSSLVMVLPELLSIEVLDRFLGDRTKTRADFERLSVLQGSDTFIKLAELANFSNPLATATIKQIAYKLAQVLEMED